MKTLAELQDALRREGLLRRAFGGAGGGGGARVGTTVSGLSTDSRGVGPGALFIAVRGSCEDGHRYVRAAAERGAAAVVVERESDVSVPQIVVTDGRRAAIALAREWFGNPAAGLELFGVTGTNGKTTSTMMLAHLLNQKADTGAMGTLGAFDGAGSAVPSAAGSLTTPGPVELQATFADLRGRGVRRVAMETSSHSLDQGRLEGLVFQAAIFTNLTLDHLDYHGTMEHYLAAKLRLLGLLAKDAVLAVNADDPAWTAIPRTPRTVTFGLSPDADLRAVAPALDSRGCRFRIEGRFGTGEAEVPLPGRFNVSNALGAAACALGLGLTLREAIERLARVPQVPGRMERLVSEPFLVLRDYAHTPDALERALETLRALTRGRLIVLFGCGGDRDRNKRPVMGKLAGSRADFAIITSDNPRTEDPDRIIDEIMVGVPPQAPHRRVVDRRQAIAEALAMARPGDTVLLAGKGHETYQVLGTRSYPFDERDIVAELLRTRPPGDPGAVD